MTKQGPARKCGVYTEEDVAVLSRTRELRLEALDQPEWKRRMPTELRYGYHQAFMRVLMHLEGSKFTYAERDYFGTYLGFKASGDPSVPVEAIDILDQHGKQIDRLEGGKWNRRPDG